LIYASPSKETSYVKNNLYFKGMRIIDCLHNDTTIQSLQLLINNLDNSIMRLTPKILQNPKWVAGT
jgi:hypothetical protein